MNFKLFIRKHIIKIFYNLSAGLELRVLIYPIFFFYKLSFQKCEFSSQIDLIYISITHLIFSKILWYLKDANAVLCQAYSKCENIFSYENNKLHPKFNSFVILLNKINKCIFTCLYAANQRPLVFPPELERMSLHDCYCCL